METMKANDILFRCSSLSHIMVEGERITEKQLATILEYEAKKNTPKGLTDKQAAELERLIAKRDAPAELPETCITHLLDVYASFEHGRREEKTNKYLDKGNIREEDSITLLSLHTRKLFEKNSTRLRNRYIQGEPDLFEGESIENAEHTIDTKTCWSLHTFLRSKYKKLDPAYKWQGVGYMDLTSAKKHTVAFCLVNGTADAIRKEKRDLAFKLKITDETDSAFRKKCQQIERNHIFDLQAFMQEYPGFQFDSDLNEWKWDIPMEKRVHTKTFQRDENEIRAVHDQVLICREWMETNLFTELAEVR